MLKGFNEMSSIAEEIAGIRIETTQSGDTNGLPQEALQLPMADMSMFWKWIIDGQFMDCAQLLDQAPLSASELRRAKMILVKKTDSLIKKPSGADRDLLLDAIKALEFLGVDSAHDLLVETSNNCLASTDSDFGKAMETILDVAKLLDLDIGSALSKISIPSSKLLCLSLILDDRDLSMGEELFTTWLNQVATPANIIDLIALSNDIAKQTLLRPLPRKWLIEFQQKIGLIRLNDEFQGKVYHMYNLLTPILGDDVEETTAPESEHFDAPQLFAPLGLPRVSRLL